MIKEIEVNRSSFRKKFIVEIKAEKLSLYSKFNIKKKHLWRKNQLQRRSSQLCVKTQN